jgi:transketolase
MSTMMTQRDIDTLSINTIRTLCMHAVQKAISVRPGTPMGVVPVAYTCGNASFASIRAIRSGPTGTGSCCPRAMPQPSCCPGRPGRAAGRGIKTRVVSMPSWELFDRQPQEYRDEVLPPAVKARVSIEQGSTLGWDRYVGDGGAVIGMHTFGASAPLEQLLTKFGFTPDRVAEVARERVAAARRG